MSDEYRGTKELERLFVEFTKALEENNLNKASASLNTIWVLFHLMITPITNPELKELNFFKVPIDMDNGGKYLLQFLHVSGAKITFNKDLNGTINVKEQETV